MQTLKMIGVKSILFFIMGLLIFNLLPAKSIGAADTALKADLAGTVNKYMEKKMKEQHIAGAVVTIVKDGKVVLNKGYGYADISQQKKVDPDSTLFRIGSVSKLFTAVAAMQQVEQKKISLNEDVNTYYKDMQVQNPYAEPLTLEHLLTQTSGLAESVEGIYSEGLREYPKPLIDTLQEHLPPLERPPGEVIQYSNYGYTLIGHLVEQVTGDSFDNYLTEHIFAPLQMSHSFYALSPENVQYASRGYAYENDTFTSQDPGSVLVYPAGAIVSTGGDMAKFLLANLQNGIYENTRILNTATAKLMREKHFSVHSSLPGYGYGFYEDYRNPDIVMHNGDADTFTSQLSISPKQQLGYFVSYNTLDDGALREGLEDVIYGYYNVPLNGGTPINIPTGLQAEDTEALSGSYVFAQRLLEGPLKSRGLFLKIAIKDAGDGNIKVQAFDSRVSGMYIHAGDHLYVSKENGRQIYFKQDSTGKQYAVINMDVPLQTLEKLNTKEMIMEYIVRPFVFSIAAVGMIWGILRFLFRKKINRPEGYSLKARIISNWLNILIILIGVCIILVMFTSSESFRAVVLVIVWVISAIIALLSLIMLRFGIKGWSTKQLGKWNAVFYILLLCSSVGAVSYSYFLDLY
ncbi:MULTISPECIES: serine hydrolase [Paenibacillus]|uniref:serine hydrolase n=1 Tax=Paenibacillus TaxID=44249 RepID=UPI00037583DF|nr:MULTISPECIES: serine hydrolase [Paenibacillus]